MFIAPAALALILTMAAPMADAVLLSLQHWNGMSPPTWAGFSNYLNLIARRDVLQGALAHRLLHGLHRDPADHSAVADRQPAQFRHPRKHGVPDALLHAGDHFAGDQRPALGDAVRAQFRRRQQLPASDRTGRFHPALARRRRHRDAERDHRVGLAVARFLSRHLLRRAAKRANRPLRGGRTGRRQCMEPLPDTSAFRRSGR